MSLSCETRGIRADVRTRLHAVLAVCTLTGVLGAASGATAQVADAGAPPAAPPNGGAAVLGQPAPPPADPNAPPAGYAPAPPPQAPGAYGQQPPQGYGQPGYVEPVQEAPPVVEHVRTDDANADHIVVGSTAFTAPKGSVYFSDYELLIIQGGVAITDNFQLTLTAFAPIMRNFPYFFDLSGKFAFVQTPRFHLAALASLLGADFRDAFTSGGSSSLVVVGRLGLVATACITENCYVSASASAIVWLWEGLTDAAPITGNIGIIARLVGVFSLLAEANFGGAIGSGGSFFGAGGAVLGYGIRFSQRNFGFDLTLIKPVYADSSSDEFPAGVPWLAFTYRTDALF